LAHSHPPYELHEFRQLGWEASKKNQYNLINISENATPLGMIIDHNLDSLIIMFQGINMTTSMMFGNTLYSYYLYCIPAIPFYIITLEEYYTNVMDLPIVNAACEGCLSVAVVFLIPVFMGKTIWVDEWAYGLPLNKLTMIGFVVFASISTPFVYNNIRIKTP
jgi:ethanolaminephosphotransferase